MAIQNSEFAGVRQTAVLAVFGMVLVLLSAALSGETLDESDRRLQRAKIALDAQPNDVERGWRLAEACFHRAEFARHNTERSKLAEQGIAAARQVLRRNSNSVEARFYLAVNLGQLARTRTLTALGIVAEMERQFLAAIAINPKFRHAAPDRSLGMLYLEAPGWPTSVGSRSKARIHLQKAIEVDPSYPENWLTLMEAEIKWGDRKKVQGRLTELGSVMEKAKSAWVADEGEQSWKALLDRVEKIRTQVVRSR